MTKSTSFLSRSVCPVLPAAVRGRHRALTLRSHPLFRLRPLLHHLAMDLVLNVHCHRSGPGRFLPQSHAVGQVQPVHELQTGRGYHQLLLAVCARQVQPFRELPFGEDLCKMLMYLRRILRTVYVMLCSRIYQNA